MLTCTGLEFLGHFLAKALNIGNFGHRNVSNLFQRGEAFRGQQLCDHFIGIKGGHEHFRTLLELFLAAFGFFLLGENINVPAGENRG